MSNYHKNLEVIAQGSGSAQERISHDDCPICNSKEDVEPEDLRCPFCKIIITKDGETCAECLSENEDGTIQ